MKNRRKTGAEILTFGLEKYIFKIYENVLTSAGPGLDFSWGIGRGQQIR